jgi:hypothetical protein
MGHYAHGYPKLNAPFRRKRLQRRRRSTISRLRSAEHMDAIRALLANDISFTKRLFSFWTFTGIWSNIFYIKNSRSGKSISNEFIIFWMTIKNWKEFNSQRSSWNSSSQNRDFNMRMYIDGWNLNSLRQSTILHINRFVYCEANSCMIIDQSKESDDLGLFLAFWNLEHGCPTTTRNI